MQTEDRFSKPLMVTLVACFMAFGPWGASFSLAESGAKPSAMPPTLETEKTKSDGQTKSQDKAEKKAQETGADKAAAARQKILSEALTALRETQNAIKALDKKDGKAALAALEKVVGKLEILLARAPDLALAPVDVSTRTLDLYAPDPKVIEKARDEAVSLLKKGRLQEARRLVSGLASEIIIEVVNIPLATYPKAIKGVVPLIEAGKTTEARDALVAALNTLVITRHIIPLPVLRAEHLLDQAEKLAEKEKRSEAEQKQLDELLAEARKELQFAEALGYGEEGDFKPFFEELEKIAGKTSEGKHGRGFFDKLKKALSDFRTKLF